MLTASDLQYVVVLDFLQSFSSFLDDLQLPLVRGDQLVNFLLVPERDPCSVGITQSFSLREVLLQFRQLRIVVLLHFFFFLLQIDDYVLFLLTLGNCRVQLLFEFLIPCRQAKIVFRHLELN